MSARPGPLPARNRGGPTVPRVISRRRLLLPLTAAAALTAAAPAAAAVSAPPVPSHFAYHAHTVDDGRCSDVYGIEFAPIAGPISYTYEYHDGYYNSDDNGTETIAEFLMDDSTPSLYFHGITGGEGPGPCTSQAPDDGGRFTVPPTVFPNYPDGKYPPLAATTSKSSPSGAANVDIKAGRGVFPLTTQVNVEIHLKAPSGSLLAPKLGTLKAGNGADAFNDTNTYISSIPGHKSVTIDGTVTGKKAGRVPLSFKFTARTKHGRKVTASGTSSVIFG